MTDTHPLTPAERAVLDGAARGEIASETAERLLIGESTVRAHRKSILRKLQTHTIAGAVYQWYVTRGGE